MELVSVLISIYNPDWYFFEKQLRSLDNQDYENLEVVIRDDNPDSEFREERLAEVMKKKPYRYIRAEKNLGYGGSFEELTYLARGSYVAYCDQDDIWHSDKISKSVRALQEQNAIFVTSDRAIIDEHDQIVEESYRANHHNICDVWKTGDSILPQAVFTTYAIGHTIVMKTDSAREILPLPENTAHDKWLTAGAAVKGKMVFIEEPLVDYRRHSSNVSGVMKGITTKQDYYKHRVDYSFYLANQFVKRFPEIAPKTKKEICVFATARKKKHVLQMYRMRWIAPTIIKFEILMKFMPEPLFEKALKMLKK